VAKPTRALSLSNDRSEPPRSLARVPPPVPPGKIALAPTKQLTNQRDLALAYSPGVAAACDEIVRDPAQVSTLTPAPT